MSQDYSQYDLTHRQIEILNIMTANGRKMSVSDISSQLKIPPAARTLRDDFARLKSLGLIDLEGRGRASKWFIIKK